MHLELVSYFATAPSTGALATPFGSGTANADSLTVKNARGTIMIVDWWAHSLVSGSHAILSDSMHDRLVGNKVITVGSGTSAGAGRTQRLIVPGLPMQVQPQEDLSINVVGSNTSGDVECGSMMIAYEGLPGISPRLIAWDDLLKLGVTNTAITASIAGSGAGYSGSELINADVDVLKANTDYALLGIVPGVEVLNCWISGPDTGNVKMGVPGFASDRDKTQDYFAYLSRITGMATIPVINSGNKKSTYIGIGGNENATATPITLVLIELAQG